MDDVVGADELVALVDAEMPLDAAPPRYRGEVATRYRYRDGEGEFGLIASVTKPFCGDCTRARLSAEGGSTRACSRARVTTCGPSLRDPAGRRKRRDAILREAIGAIWRVRDDRYSEERTEATSARLPRIEMFAMGG